MADSANRMTGAYYGIVSSFSRICDIPRKPAEVDFKSLIAVFVPVRLLAILETVTSCAEHRILHRSAP